MDSFIYNASLKEAKRLMLLSKDDTHDFRHAKEVAYYASKIGRELNYPDIKFLKLAAWWHDVGRLYKEEHEELSAQMAKDNLSILGSDENEVEKMFNAIKLHKWNMQPETIEGNIIRDADKLDCLSSSRWKKSKKGDGKYMNSLIPLLPNLKSMLYFEISKKIYDQKAESFYLKIKSNPY
ncbi:MAG: HD domain-containing protein [Candidatus Moraniibacteriota bacterium]